MDDIQRQHKKRRAITIAAILAVVALIVFELLQVGGNTRFYTTWIYCGEKPVATDTFEQGGSAIIYHYEPSTLPGIHSSWSYFCTPLEAEQAGYSASPTQYEFPHLQRGA